jgi:hypothetical protein
MGALVIDKVRDSAAADGLGPHSSTRQDLCAERDSLSAARGIVLGVGSSFLIWCVIGGLLYLVL